MNTADGTIRATASRIATACGGDEAFWLAVARVGWLRFDGPNATVEGWEKRFSRAAKARMEDARRKAAVRAVRLLSEKCPEKTGLQERTIQEKRGQEKEILPAAPVPASKPAARSPAKPVVSWSADAGWDGITAADRSEWAAAYPGAVLDRELAKATAWLRANPKRAGRRNWRRFIVNWLQRCQDKGGTDREPGRRPEDKPPLKSWRDEYRPAPYRTPKESAALASTLKLKEENLNADSRPDS